MNKYLDHDAPFTFACSICALIAIVFLSFYLELHI
jgi:hypothetical protein